MKRVLLTGGTGFIGRHCLPDLLARGYETHAVTRKGAPVGNGNVSWHSVDLFDAASVTELVARVRPSHLLHLAWDTTHRLYWTSADNLRWVKASLDLLHEFVRHGGQRIVCAGTCAEYDWSHGYCLERVTPLSPSTLYGSCKHALRLMIEAFAKQQGLSCAWGRLFFLYGPYEQPQRFVPSVVRSLLAGQSAACTHGRQLRDFLFAADAASALVTLLDSEVCGPVNIASGEPIALKDLARRIGECLGRPDLLSVGQLVAPPDDPPVLLANVSRLAGELSWSPRYSLDEGLQKTIEWWRANRLQEAA